MSYFLRKITLVDSDSSDSLSFDEAEIKSKDEEVIELSDEDIDSIVDELINLSIQINQEVIMTSLNIDSALKLIPEFNGSSLELDRFLHNCSLVFKSLAPTEEVNFVNLCISRLTGKAFQIIQRKDFKKWDDLKLELKSQFRDTRTVDQLQVELINATQRKNETVLAFSNRIEELMNDLINLSIEREGTAASNIITNLYSRTGLKAFEEGLQGPIKIIIKACRFEKLKDAVNKACDEEKLSLERKNTNYTDFSTFSSNNSIKCQICQKLGHSALKCFQRIQQPSNFRNNNFTNSNPTHSNMKKLSHINIICAYCKIKGHHISNCFKKQNVDRRQSKLNTDNTSDTPNEPSKNEDVTRQEDLPVRAQIFK